MAKRTEELATEITIAWIQSICGKGEINPVVNLSCVNKDSVIEFYEAIHSCIKASLRNPQ